MSSREQPQPQRDRPPAHHLHVGLASHNLHLLARSLIGSSACCSRGIAARFDSGHLRKLKGTQGQLAHSPALLLATQYMQSGSSTSRKQDPGLLTFLFVIRCGLHQVAYGQLQAAQLETDMYAPATLWQHTQRATTMPSARLYNHVMMCTPVAEAYGLGMPGICLHSCDSPPKPK